MIERRPCEAARVAKKIYIEGAEGHGGGTWIQLIPSVALRDLDVDLLSL